MTLKELEEILENHKLWLERQEEEVKMKLSITERMVGNYR